MSQKKIVLFNMDGVLAKWKENGEPKSNGFMATAKLLFYLPIMVLNPKWKKYQCKEVACNHG